MRQDKTLPQGWAATVLDEVLATVEAGSRPKGGVRGITSGVPSLGGEHLSEDGKFRLESIRYVPEAFAQKQQRGWIKHRDILVVKDGATTGKTSFVGGDFPYQRALINEHVLLLRPWPGIAPEYVFYYLRSADGRAGIMSDFRGAAQGGISKDFSRKVRNPVAPLPEQHRIVAKIEELFTDLDAGVAALERAKANLKRYRASVLKAACEGKLVPTEAKLARREGRTYETGAQLLERILTERREKWKGKGNYKEPFGPGTTSLPELPEGWVWATAEQICEFITKGTTPRADKLYNGSGEVRFLKVYSLTFTGQLNHNYKPVFVDRKTHDGELARSKVRSGDVLINIVGPPLGQVAVVPDDVAEANINQAIARFSPLNGVSNHFLSIAFQSKSVMSWAINRAKTTAGQANLTLEICRALPVPLPPVIDQERIVAEVERHLSVVEELEVVVNANLHRASRLCQAILKQAFEGKLVPQDPFDEPASVLLGRIRAAKASVGGEDSRESHARTKKKAMEISK